GFTEGRKLAAACELNHVQVAPHHDCFIHAQLVASTPAGCIVEAFTDPERDPLQAELDSGFFDCAYHGTRRRTDAAGVRAAQYDRRSLRRSRVSCNNLRPGEQQPHVWDVLALPFDLGSKNRSNLISDDCGRLPKVLRFDATTLWCLDAAEWMSDIVKVMT